MGHVEHPNIKLEALDVAIERCFDVLFDVHEAIEGFFGCWEREVFREELNRE